MRTQFLVISSLLFSIFSTPNALSAGAGKAAKTAPKPASAPAPKGASILWDEWYTITIGGKIRYGYYNERVEMRDDKVFLKNDFWKQEEDYINREALGVLSENNEKLSPVLFNFHSVYRTTETSIDGNVRDGKFFTAKAKRAGKDLPVVQKTVAGGVFFSSMFPVWIGKRLGTMKEGQQLRFATIMEDNLDLAFQTMDGEVKLEKPDDFAKSSGTKKLRVDSRGMRTFWWVNERGFAQKIEMPEQKIVVERAPAEKAKKFLDGTI